MKALNNVKTVCLVAVGLGVAVLLSSCVPLAAGAAGGYMLRDEGYEVQSPVTR